MYSSQIILGIIDKIKQSEVVVENDLVVDFNQFLDGEDSLLVYVVAPETQVHSDVTFYGSTYTLDLGLVYRVFNQSVGLEGLETMLALDIIADELKASAKDLGLESFTISRGTQLASIYENGVKDFEIQFQLSYFR